MNRISIIVFSLLTFLNTYSAIGQSQYAEIGAGIGISTYSGDLSPPEIRQIVGTSLWSGTGYVRYNLTPLFNVKGGLVYAKIQADDAISSKATQSDRNLSFYSNLFELAITGEFNLLPYRPLETRKAFTLYLLTGIAGFHFNPVAELDGNRYKLQKLSTEGQGLDEYPDKKPYTLYDLAIPFGGGLKWKISESVNLNAELNWRFAFTDYLDDVSGTYPDLDILRARRGDIAASLSNRSDGPRADGTQRGNSSVGDYYFTFHAGLSYNIASSMAIGGHNRVSRRRSQTTSCPKF